jgi:hypothetical protein
MLIGKATMAPLSRAMVVSWNGGTELAISTSKGAPAQSTTAKSAAIILIKSGREGLVNVRTVVTPVAVGGLKRDGLDSTLTAYTPKIHHNINGF